MKSLTLYELNSLVRETIETSLDDEFWVEAELSETREVRGHCYMELVQNDFLSHTPVARASARCWKNTWLQLRPHFEHVTGQKLHAGMKVLLRVRANFHEAFGFSWIVNDIDPTYTMGDMARRRQEIIRQLKEEGVFDLQKELVIPLFCQRIAVISSATAAGYGDFCNQLADNEHGFRFTTQLFEATMQGEQVEGSVIAALDRINAQADRFDAVVIIRGGGATADLSGFDTLALAENVANFPLPIITGIGHDRDESILDMVSQMRVKTPTAAAALFIDHLKRIWERIDDAERRMTLTVTHQIANLKSRVAAIAILIPTLTLRVLSDSRHRVDMLENRLPVVVDQQITGQKHLLNCLELMLQGFDPQLLLSRGYSITLRNGRAIRDLEQLKAGDEIETKVEKGIFKSIVK